MKCTACKKKIVFCLTKNDNRIPVDADTLTEEDKLWLINRRKENYNELLPFRYGEHIAHFATCTNPDYFRKEKNVTPNK